MVGEGDCVAIFHSIQRVMKAEKRLLEAEIDILLIPVPRSLSADCGMAIRFSQPILKQVEATLEKANLKIAELWQMQDGDFMRLS